MRWMRFFKPLSGIGQTNLPVQAIDQTVLMTVSVFGSPNICFAMGPSGSYNSSFTMSLVGLTIIQLGMGVSSRQRPIGQIIASLLTRSGLLAASSAATMPPNE